MSSNVVCNVNLDPNRIIEIRHLQRAGQAEAFFTNEVKRLADPYTPMDSGTLKSNVLLTPNSITYNSPYAKYQYYGVSKNGNPLTYNGAPMRGKEWIPRMWADRKQDILNSVARFVGGKVI